MKKLLFLLVAVSPAAAQNPKPLCWQAGPRSECRAFVLTEFGGGLLLAGNQPDNRWALFQYGLGAVKSVSNRVGLGGAVFATYSEEAITVGVAPRLRYWASPKLSFDVAPGLVVFQGGSRNLGLNAYVAANLGPHLSLTSTVQMTDSNYDHFARVEWFAGVRVNGKLGTITGLATPVLTILTYIVFFAPRST